jgi:ABC-type uncharacterized transport system substrate-binding protein
LLRHTDVGYPQLVRAIQFHVLREIGEDRIIVIAIRRRDKTPALMLLGIGGDSSALAAKAATSTIPVVFGMGSDPVQAGMVTSLNRPGGNVTGVNLLINELEPKRLGLLNELVPGTALIGALLNPKFPPSAQQAKELREAAQTIGRLVVILKPATMQSWTLPSRPLSSSVRGLCWWELIHSSVHGAMASSHLRPNDSCRQCSIFVSSRWLVD